MYKNKVILIKTKTDSIFEKTLKFTPFINSNLRNFSNWMCL